jgi:ABC-type glycerol-3-phosphate transport system permease component
MDRMSLKNQRRVSHAFGYLAMIVLVLIIGLPVWWMISGSLKTNQEIYTFPPDWIPRDPKWSNFQRAWVRPLLPQQLDHHVCRLGAGDHQRHA